MKIVCCENFYVSTALEKKKDRILKRLEKRKHLSSFYIIIVPQGTKSQLEFFPAVFLKQPAFDEKTLFLAGLAADHDDAVFLVERMTHDALQKNGDTDIRAYIQGTQKIQES